MSPITPTPVIVKAPRKTNQVKNLTKNHEKAPHNPEPETEKKQSAMSATTSKNGETTTKTESLMKQDNSKNLISLKQPKDSDSPEKHLMTTTVRLKKDRLPDSISRQTGTNLSVLSARTIK